MSVKQRILVIAVLIVTVLLAVVLLAYSVSQAQEYDGIFVSGIRRVWY